MRLTGDTSSRLGIYFFFDKEGIVDDFVTYFIEELKKSLERLVIVCNGRLSNDGRRKFQQYTQEIIVRENVGLDVWAYKTALDYVGWEQCASYDEIVLCNSTSMGPVYPFEEMFESMSQRDVDFWGITKTHMVKDYDFDYNPYGYLPEHIQSNFIVYRNSLIVSMELKAYWDSMPMITSYEQSIGLYESAFTKLFADKGFAWDVYVDTSRYEGVVDQPLMFYPARLIAEQRCPIFKRRSFFHFYSDVLLHTAGQSSLLLYNYLKDHTSYDVNMIWDNILRCYNLNDIAESLHLNYTLSTRLSDYNEYAKCVENEKIALVMHLYFEDMFYESFELAKAIPPEADVYITTNTEEKRLKLEQIFRGLPCGKLEVLLVENRGRDVSAFLVGVREKIKEYTLVCFSHDKKTTQSSAGSIGESFAYQCYSNILYNRTYIENIVTLFGENERLGLVVPPPPDHGEYHLLGELDWQVNYEATKKLCEELGVQVSIEKNKKPIAPYGSVFWFRPAAIEKLLDRKWNYNDFCAEPMPVDGTISHAIERCYAFCAQAAGYYTAVVMSDEFSRIQYTNLKHYIKEDLEIQNLRVRLDDMYKSTSWKVSKPVRVVGEFIKSIKRRK